MRSPKQFPIKKRVNRALLFTSLLVLGTTCFFFAIYELVLFKKSLTNEVSSMAQFMSINSAAPLAFGDKKGARELLDTLNVKPRIRGARVYDANGKVFASYEPGGTKAGNLLPEEPGEPGETFLNEHIYFFQPVQQSGEVLGTLLIVSDFGHIYMRLKYYAGIVVLVFGIALFVAYRMSSILNENVSEPILNLAGAMRRVVDEADVSIRATKKNDDELGFLVEQFNSMLEQIQIGKEELEKTRDSLEVRVKERTEELERSRMIAEKANLAKSEFLARMSHELRTPLNAVIGFGQLLEMNLADQVDPTDADSISHIVTAGNHLLELINEILDLSKIESGHLILSIEDVRVSDVMQEVQNLMGTLATDYEIQLNINLEEMEDVYVFADNIRLRQVLINLITNAIKYNKPDGSVTVTCHPGKAQDTITIKVTDTGIGIKLERLNEVFEPFNRLDAEYTGIEGTGIGLALTQKLIHLMNGEISIETKEGSGSCFSVHLPQGKLPGEIATPEIESAAPDQNGESLSKFCVLYVEDNPLNLSLVEQVFERKLPQVRFVTATDGPHGIELAKEQRPDLILLDLNLPGLSGRDVFLHLQEIDYLKSVPVLAVSAEAMQADIERTLAMGFKSYITKPLDLNKFYSIINHYIS